MQESEPLASQTHWYHATQRVKDIVERGPQGDSKAEDERSTVEVETGRARASPTLFAKADERNLALFKVQTQHRHLNL